MMSKLLKKSMSCKLSTTAVEGIVNKASTSRKGKEKVIDEVNEDRNTPQFGMSKKKKEKKEKAKPMLNREVATGKKKKKIIAYWKKMAANFNVVGQKKPKVKVSRSITTTTQAAGDDDHFNDHQQEQEARYWSSSSVNVQGAATDDQLAPTSGNITPAATTSGSTTPSSSAGPSPRRGRPRKVDRHGNPIPPRSVVEKMYFPH